MSRWDANSGRKACPEARSKGGIVGDTGTKAHGQELAMRRLETISQLYALLEQPANTG